MAYDPEDKDTKAAIAKAVKEAVATATEEEVEGLKAKNDDLITRLKKAQKDATIDPADHAALQADLDASETKLIAAEKALKAATAESGKIKEQYDAESKASYKLLVENGLTQALVEAKVPPKALDRIVRSFINDEKNKIAVVEENGSRVAKVGDKPLAEFIKEWASSDEGKTIVGAPGNSGGGAPGGEGGKGGEALEKMAPKARLNAINEAAATE